MPHRSTHYPNVSHETMIEALKAATKLGTVNKPRGRITKLDNGEDFRTEVPGFQVLGDGSVVFENKIQQAVHVAKDTVEAALANLPKPALPKAASK